MKRRNWIDPHLAEVPLFRGLSMPQLRLVSRRESLEAYAADALYQVMTGKREVKSASLPKVIVRVDLDALLRGHPVDGETVRSRATGRWRCPRSPICSTPGTRSSPRS